MHVSERTNAGVQQFLGCGSNIRVRHCGSNCRPWASERGELDSWKICTGMSGFGQYILWGLELSHGVENIATIAIINEWSKANGGSSRYIDELCSVYLAMATIPTRAESTTKTRMGQSSGPME